jgi:RimJ/RimL family protein N-acetyltransferase
MNTYSLKNNDILVIRRGSPEDAANFVDYANTCAGQSDFLTFNQGEFSTVDAQRISIEELTDGKVGLFLIAEIGDRIVGNITFRLGKRPKTAHVGEFGISVHKDYWGFGIGRLLIKSLIKWAQETEHVRKINLKVRTDNQRGIQLYNKMGFEQEGVLRRDFFSNGVFFDAFIMGYCVDGEKKRKYTNLF